jgi:inositol hexakisphosphate/diphosphoinositol-pentakisphosphate kinase
LSRVKLPKSFLAVNLAESHTFHKKEELSDELTESTAAETRPSTEESNTATTAEMKPVKSEAMTEPVAEETKPAGSGGDPPTTSL